MAEGSDISATAVADAEKLQAEKAAQKAHRAKVRRLFWMTQARVWHWITGAATLVGMLLFAVTGITLNHAAQIESRPAVTARELQLPSELKALVAPDAPAPSSPRVRRGSRISTARSGAGREFGMMSSRGRPQVPGHCRIAAAAGDKRRRWCASRSLNAS